MLCYGSAFSCAVPQKRAYGCIHFLYVITVREHQDSVELGGLTAAREVLPQPFGGDHSC